MNTFASMTWTVEYSRRVQKQIQALPPARREDCFALLKEIEILGPVRTGWPHYGKIEGAKECHHCHLNKGRPTYVVVWKIKDKAIQVVEVKYAGTHENADYGRLG